MSQLDSAAAYIKEEHERFIAEATDTILTENNFEELTRSDYTRRLCAGDILTGMLIRGRHQAAVFSVFMQLCKQGVCSLEALKYPIAWNKRGLPGTCFSYIYCRLGQFCAFPDWDATQEQWGIKETHRWHDYQAPTHWLAVMIGRTFTSLDEVFSIIRASQGLGPVKERYLENPISVSRPDQTWKGDINLNRPERRYDTGTFAFWLPFEVPPPVIDEGFDNAEKNLSCSFYGRLGALELEYKRFFNVDEDTRESQL
ncbi:hypothetical protein VTL71DRAFT_15296 [Oculimacula yallundae]|uniref:Uncharacterized protein n=1 Tax=Oculimacula yallundae TaxID=86028 RepID=A0ABR4CG65_9HELO